MEEKQCPKCREVKPFSAFSLSQKRRDGLQTYCKECCSEKMRERRSIPALKEREREQQKAYLKRVKYAPQRKWVENNRDKRREYYQKWYAKNGRAKQLRETYGITIEEYDAHVTQQNGLCAICGRLPGLRSKGRLHIDHDHATGKIRGLLCFDCNNGIGCLQDSVVIVQHALEYLQKTAPS